MNIPIREYVAQLDLDQLSNLKEVADSRIKVLLDAKKEEYLVVSDEDLNWGFFRKDDIEGALEMFCKRVRGGCLNRGGRTYLQLSVEKFRSNEVEDLIIEKQL